MLLRISTPAVPEDWHAKMWTVMKEQLDKTAPGEFDVQINLNAALFKQGTEPAAMARGNLEMSSISAFDIAKLVPEFSIFTAYVVRDPAQRSRSSRADREEISSGVREDGVRCSPPLSRPPRAQPARGAQRAPPRI